VRTATKVFVLSGVFGVGVAIVYWFVSSEPAGTILLASMGIAAWVIAIYTGREASRHPQEPEDRADAEPSEGSGAVIGRFVVETPWPLAFAAGLALVVAGLVFGPFLLLLGVVLSVVAVAALMRESIT
jgi:hypothetical protein